MLTRLTAVTFLAAILATATMIAPAAAESSLRYFPQAAIMEWSGEHYTIIRIDSLRYDSEERIQLNNWMDAYPDQIEALQDTIVANGGFAAALRSRGVQLNNVAAVQQAFSGNLIVFLR